MPCRTFDAAADGYGRGEGCVVIVLGPADTGPVPGTFAAVLGSAVNQDGRSSSLTAPNGPSQSRLIGSTLASGGLQPDVLGLVAVHGTGDCHNGGGSPASDEYCMLTVMCSMLLAATSQAQRKCWLIRVAGVAYLVSC